MKPFMMIALPVDDIAGCTSQFCGEGRYSRVCELADVAWREARRFDFSGPSVLDQTVTREGRWEIADNRLCAVDGAQNRAILLGQLALDPVCIEFDAICHPNPNGWIGDISILVNVSAEDKTWSGDGYLFTTASFYNDCSSFYRQGIRFAHTEFSAVVPGRRYRVRLEMSGGLIRYWLDDCVVLEARDSNPLPLSRDRWFGLRTWNTRLEVSRLAVYTC
jgi:hypothetical protein